MFKLPKFRLYGEKETRIEETIQPKLELRSWAELEPAEKEIARQQLENSDWIKDYSREIFRAISYLNSNFLRILPGKNLHKIPPKNEMRGHSNESERIRAALTDFQTILLHEKSEALVFRMLTVFAESYIKDYPYQQAEKEVDDQKRREYVDEAFKQFDRLANCLNHIFEQFAVNAVLTRNGLVPRQDEKITDEIYIPTLRVLADPKWKNISKDLSETFDEYRNKNYPETITKAHRAVQRFLQILVGEEGKNGQGEVGKLFSKAKYENIIPINRFTEPIIQVFQSFISSERATNSTAKPTEKTATSSDALLIMNVVMVFLQHCLQENK